MKVSLHEFDSLMVDIAAVASAVVLAAGTGAVAGTLAGTTVRHRRCCVLGGLVGFCCWYDMTRMSCC